eukprot:6862914-Karenia_brevis.AAC.1
MLACHKKHCEDVGFAIHEEESAAHWAVSLGFMIDTLSGEYRCTPERMWKIRQAFKWLSRRPRVTGREVERLVGHATFMFLVSRGLLSIFCNIYAFIHHNYNHRVRLWSSVVQECKAVVGLIAFARTNLRRPWATCVTMVDSSLSGFGIVESEWTKEHVREVASFDERWRFKVEYQESQDPAGSNILEADPFSDPNTVLPMSPAGRWVWGEVDDFPDIPES